MPEKLDRCVRQVMAQGNSEQSAFAICNAAMGEAEWAEASDEVKNIARASLAESDHEESILTKMFNAIAERFDLTEKTETKESLLIESGDEPKLGNLVEKAVRGDGSIEVKVIEEGWGSSGFYPREILERDGPKAFPKGTQMFWNHQTLTEELERPEGSLNDLAGVFISDARWNESGKDGPGLYADARITKGYQEAVNDLAGDIGVSIRAKGETKHGEAEGRRGPIVQSIDEGRSVDFVTQAGAGGKIIELFESKRGLNVPTRNVEADMSEQELQEARDALAERDKRIAELERERAVNQAKSGADNLITEAVKDSKLPSVSIGRVRKMAMASIPLNEANELDEAKFKSDVQDMVKDEIAYLTEVAGGVSSPVFGMGESSETSVENFEEQLEGIFSDGFGLSESAAKSAARR